MATLLVVQGPSQFKPGFNLFSRSKYVQLGQENAAQVRKQMTMVNILFKELCQSDRQTTGGFARGAGQRLSLHL